MTQEKGNRDSKHSLPDSLILRSKGETEDES